MRPADSRAHEGCSSLCSPRSSRGTAPVLSFLNLLSGKRRIMKGWQFPLGVPTGLTEDELQNVRHYGPNWTTSFSFVPHSPLCPKHAMFPVPSELNISDWPIISNKQLTRFWLANLFTTFQVTASHSQACNTDCSWIVEHEINDEHVFVTTVDWTVARLSTITVNSHRPLMVRHNVRNTGY